MVSEIRLPRLNANDVTVRLVAWLVPDGGRARRGEPVCAVETTKASAEIDSEMDGFVRHAAWEGDEMDVGSLVGWVGGSEDEIRELRRPQPASGPKITHKARRLAERLGVRVEDVPASGGLVRERDVSAFAGARRPGAAESGAPRGSVEPEFLREIQGDPGFAALASQEKVAAYRRHGALIGEGVSMGAGSVVIADNMELMDESSVGAGARVRAVVLSLGRMSMIGDRADAMAREIRIGDVLYMGGDVLIGGGGAWGAASRLVVGDLCLISRHCVLNTGCGIVIGNEVGLSPHVKLFTHNHWQNVLEGYHANFGPIVIEDRAYVTGDALVVPGVRIGEGSTVLANSTVGSDVAPYTMVSGNPARKVGTIDRGISIQRKERVLLRLIKEMRVEAAERLPEEAVGYAREIDLADPLPARVTLCFECRGDRKSLPGGSVVIDLGAMEVLGEQGVESDEVRNFLRRRGIRLKPIHWRYRRDAGMHNA
jgi:acetyltransferase-like isoleucine patch superfamily enzyme